MFDHKHYVPILKTKKGEIWSLRKLRSPWRAQMTPLLEMHKPPKPTKGTGQPPKPLEEHIQDVCEAIKQAWGTSNLFFLDTEWINSIRGTSAAVTMSLNACRASGLKPIPVVRINHDNHSLDAIKSAIYIDLRGCMIRVDFEDVNAQIAIRGVLKYLELQKSEMHFLLDYRDHAMNLTEDVPKILSLKEWATFTASSGAFPKTISTLPQKMWVDIPRHDWNTWEQSMTAGELPRKPAFSDYATRYPGAPAEGGDPHVHLRYTQENKWLVYLDGTVQSGDAKNMPSICRRLIGHPGYSGQSFSEGDKEIFSIAYQGDASEELSGGATQWVQWCANHHLTFVAQQLQTHTGV
jgi:hypothetical protein